MIRYAQGDMFDTPADIRINTVNCVGVMGAGVALAFKNRYPDMFKVYAKACKAGEVRPGTPHVWEKREFDESVTVVNLPTKDHWRQPSEYEYIEKALVWLRDFVASRGNARVTIPALGCGHGGLDWSRVQTMMEQALDGLAAEIVIFSPASSHVAGERVDDATLARLDDLGIKRLQSGDIGYPAALRGKSAAAVYMKGDVEVPNGRIVAVLPSIKPSEREMQGVLACVEELAGPNVCILTGYSAKADRPVIRAALEQGAHVIICLVEGILQFSIRRDLQDVWDEHRVTVISAAKPQEKWYSGGVGKATAVKLSLANVALVSDPAPSWLRGFAQNGTAGVSKLFYLDYGNIQEDVKTVLLQLQATPLGRSRESGKPNVAAVLAALTPCQQSQNETGDLAHVAEEQSNYQTGHSMAEKPETGAALKYPKRLIEVDLPIRRISAHARREKNVRRAHISALHIWWARRPLAACRAVLCAALWPDPLDKRCPTVFCEDVRRIMTYWSQNHLVKCSKESFPLFNRIGQDAVLLKDCPVQRDALLAFLADFADWDNTTDLDYISVARALTVAAHAALGGAPESCLPMQMNRNNLEEAFEASPHPLVVDPFAGGGAIPLEALRCGADSFSSDLNPLAVALNRVVCSYGPTGGVALAQEVRSWGKRVMDKAREELAHLYVPSKEDRHVLATIWSRTVQCEGPGCGVDVPLIRCHALHQKGKRKAYLAFDDEKLKNGLVSLHVVGKAPSPFNTVKNGSVLCPVCGYAMGSTSLRAQVSQKRGGSTGCRMIAVVEQDSTGRRYYSDGVQDGVDEENIATRIKALNAEGYWAPDDAVNPSRPSPNARGLSAVTRYGATSFRDLYTPRQQLVLLTFQKYVCLAVGELPVESREAVGVLLTLALGRLVDRNSSLCRWIPQTGAIGYTFGRQALGMVWDFAEMNPFEHSGGWLGACEGIAAALEGLASVCHAGDVAMCSATQHVLPDASASALFTDPPYYDAIPYADLSDFFYVWLRKPLSLTAPELCRESLTPKDEEAIWNPGRTLPNGKIKDERFYEQQMHKALAEGRRILNNDGIGIVVFAHKATAGWEVLLQSLMSAGWVITASWPIDTERAGRTNAIGTASLASSVHLICRPRPNGMETGQEQIGDWRDVLSELPARIGSWLPRLAAEGVVGADAIFACLGPALEIFSRYSSVETTSGEKVELREYLEAVWAEVAKQALNMIFEGADASGLEEDARLTAMWLWTMRTDAETDTIAEGKAERISGYTLEYDAARKIAQGLGCHLEKLSHLVEVNGEKAVLLSAASRARYLFGKEDVDVQNKRGKKKSDQGDLFAALELPTDVEMTNEQAELERPVAGKTVLDQLHQAMILFGASRGQALKRFLVDDGIGNSPQLWSLAQSLSALYPPQSEEKRWVDGVLARKKGLGF